MRNDERLRTIYEVMAPYIVRNEHNWRDYLAFASQFHKHSFDNILLVYAQDEDVSILATRKQWAAIGRNLIPRAKGVAVCVYRNAKLTLDYLFDVSQTTGKEIHPTDWQLSDEMKKALTERLSYAHGFLKQDFSQALYAMASESVAENYNHFLQELKQETKGHLFTEIPAGGFEAQYIQLLTDSISYFIGKKCHLPDEEIQLSDGMATVSHFNTLPLVAHLGTAVTALSKGILLEVERNIKIINRERMAQHEQTEYQSEIQGAGRDDASRSTNLQQQRSRSTSGQVRPDGPGIPQRESPGAIYDFENGWQSDGDHAPGTGRGDREDRSPDAANAPAGAASADRGHHGADATLEQSETDGGGSRTPERSPDSPLTEEQPNTEVAPSAAPVGEPSEKDGSFSVPAEQPTRHFTDAEVRRNYEYILTSTNLYPPELHSAVRSVLSEPPLNPDWSDKGRQIAALFTPYGDREYQGDLLYRTRLHGEDGISFFFDEGYTYIPWNGLAFLLDAMIEDGDYPNPVVEEQPDPIGDYNIPDEVDEMGGPHRQMTIGEADFDYVLDAVAYEAGETVVEPVKPQAIVQMENDTPAAGDEPASVPDENPPVVVEVPETALPTDTAEQPTPPPVKGNTTAHKNFRRFQELFPEIVSGQYEYLRLEAGEAYYPLVIHHKYGSHYCMEHYYMQNGDRMYDPYMDFQIDKEAGTLRAFSYENSGIGVYNEADPDDPAYEKAINGFNSFFATWLNNIRSQGYEPVRASMMVNDEEVDVDLRPAAEAVPVVEEEQPEQLSLLSLEMGTEDLLVERVMQRGPLTAGKKEQIYEFAQTHPTGSEFTAFLKKLYGYEGFSGDEMGVKYAMFNSEGVTIEWQDKQGETQETKLSWARAAGVVQRLVDEGRYLQTPVVSQPEQQDEVQPFSDQYRLLDRLCADCEYFLGAGQRAEKHLWAGSVDAQIEKMRELYAQLPEKPDWISLDIINAYARRMAAPEPVENTAEASPEETQILDEALDAHHGQIDMLMQAVRGELTVGTIRYSIFEGRPHISMIEVLEDYRRQGIATQMLRYLQGQYPNEEIVWGYLTEDGSALYQAVVDEQPNPDYLRVQNDLEDITREFDAYVRRLDGGASAVGYLFREGAFLPAQETKPVRNEFGLDLFQHRGSVYEGKTGLQFCSLQQAEDLAGFVEKHGGIEKVQKLIADSLERTGLSPRYTRPDEKKKDIFPPKEKDENRVFAKDLMGNKHYYYRFYNENGIELYTMEKKREFFQTVYIPCDGFMVGIDQRHRLEEVLKWLPTLEHGIRGEIERVFNQSMEAPDRWADLGFANLLGRYEEAKAHNAPIAAERQRQADERRAQQDAREQQLAQERQARYDSAIREAEGNIMAGKEVINREINGKSLIMQLFREHEIPVPLKTQGWIINSLHSIRYDPQIGEWNYRYFKGSRNSTKMFDLLSKLSAAIQTRQQFEEHGMSPPDSPVLDCEEEQDMEL